ncbi:MAG: alpha/beta hydrolase [Acidobacteriota bacterium]|nr:alpha/beta hydrolase [Acidobacteriota bacterium]
MQRLLRVTSALAALLLCLPLPAAKITSQAADPLPVITPPSGAARSLLLWPGGAPGALGKDELDTPRLYVYPASGETAHAAVIVLPGGGYRSLVMEKEGGIPARWLAAHGVTAFVLQYRLGKRYYFPAPMLDGARAIRYVRSHAREFGIDPNKVGLWGFSAGGHLAGYLAAVHDSGQARAADPIDRVSDRPDFTILSYARLSLSDEIPRATNFEGLLGDHPTPEALRAVSVDRLVTRDVPPALIYSTSADQTVDSRNATAYYDAVKRVGGAAELHIFEPGPHGTGMGTGLKGLDELSIFPEIVAGWMQRHGWMPAPEAARPVLARR